MWSLAWRNLWRNKRRTIITAASVVFAVFFSILMRGFHIGTWNHLIDGVLRSYTGYVQIHARGFWDNRTLDYVLNQNDTLIHKVENHKSIVNNLIPRFESFALASYHQKIKGVIVTGIDPEQEKFFTRLSEKLELGHYLNDSDKSVLVSKRLADFLKISVGDSLVLISQGYQGATASGLFAVKGVVKLPSPEFDNQMIFMSIQVAQELYSAQGKITSWIVDIKDSEKMKKVAKEIKELLPAQEYEVMTWQEMLLELYQQYVSDEGGAVIMLAILYLIVGFGIFGTAMMMINERRYELAIMIALGMQRWRTGILLSTELFFISIIGLVGGVLISLPVLYYFHLHPITFTGQMAEAYKAFGMEPIMTVAWKTNYIIHQVENVFIITVLVLIYPVYSVFRLNIIKALKR